MQINMNNPIIPLSSINMEKEEFKMQEKMNSLALKNLGKIAIKYNDRRKSVIIESNYDLRLLLK